MTNEKIASDIASMKTTLERMDRELFGNGQPGRLQKVEDRVKDLEVFQARSKGAIATLGAVTTIIGGFFGKHVLGK